MRPLVEPGPPLSVGDEARFSRHALLAQVGALGQRRLRSASVCVVGAGGLGSAALLYLAAAGVGRLGIVDRDEVDITNLQRQVLHGTADVGRRKVESARDALLAIDPGVDVVLHDGDLTDANVREILAGYDLVLDGSDNFPTRYVVNDACAELGIPLVWGSVLGFDAQVSVFWSQPPDGGGVDLRDLFPAPPAPGEVLSCAEAGVLGALCGQVGALMATEAVKLIVGAGEPLLGRVAVLDALSARWREVPLRRAPGGGARGRAKARSRAMPAAHPLPSSDPLPASAARRGADTSPAAAAPHASSPAAAAPHASSPAADVLRASSPAAVGLRAQTALPVDAADARAIEPADLAALLDGDAPPVLVDVRELAEYAAGAIPGARVLPLTALRAGEGLGDLPATGPLVLYCSVGVRSAEAARLLGALGRGDVVHLTGGYVAWRLYVAQSLADGTIAPRAVVRSARPGHDPHARERLLP